MQQGENIDRPALLRQQTLAGRGPRCVFRLHFPLVCLEKMTVHIRATEGSITGGRVPSLQQWRQGMADKAGIDRKRLWELVLDGRNVQEITDELHIDDIVDLNAALQELMEEKNLTGTGGLMGKPTINTRYTEDGIRISPAMLAGKGFKPGDLFRLRVEKNRIILDKE